MGLGKQKAKLDGELFRRTEAQPRDEALLVPSQPVSETKAEKVAKERFSLYLEPTTAKRLRLYAVQRDIKNINGLIAELIGQFLEKEGA